MRILHTSDWHLGQHFIGKSRATEHQAFLSWLVMQVSELQIDAIIVAGDIFDTATPPSYARELYNQFIVQLQPTGCQLILLAGNHDSVAVLSESKDLLACLNVQVMPSVMADVSQQLLVLNNRQQQPAVLVAAIPFIRARDVLQSQAGQTERDKQQSLQQAIATHYQQLYLQAERYNQKHNLELPIVMTGHLTTLGVSRTESVRDIYIGTLEAFAADQFPAADYIALGHIHQAQQIKAATDIRYSGSPIALSFDEAKQQKQLWLIEFTAKQKQVTSIAIPCFQPLLSIKSDLISLEKKLKLAIAELAADEQLWLEIVVTETDAYLTDLQQRVEQLCTDFPVELLRLRRQRSVVSGLLTEQGQQSLAELTPNEVWQARLSQEKLTAEQEQQLTVLHQQVLATVQQEVE